MYDPHQQMPKTTPILRTHAALQLRLHRERARVIVGSIAGVDFLRAAYDACTAHLAAHPGIGDPLPNWDDYLRAVLGQRASSEAR